MLRVQVFVNNVQAILKLILSKISKYTNNKKSLNALLMYFLVFKNLFLAYLCLYFDIFKNSF